LPRDLRLVGVNHAKSLQLAFLIFSQYGGEAPTIEPSTPAIFGYQPRLRLERPPDDVDADPRVIVFGLEFGEHLHTRFALPSMSSAPFWRLDAEVFADELLVLVNSLLISALSRMPPAEDSPEMVTRHFEHLDEQHRCGEAEWQRPGRGRRGGIKLERIPQFRRMRRGSNSTVTRCADFGAV
jgi:hypothetical protein